MFIKGAQLFINACLVMLCFGSVSRGVGNGVELPEGGCALSSFQEIENVVKIKFVFGGGSISKLPL